MRRHLLSLATVALLAPVGAATPCGTPTTAVTTSLDGLHTLTSHTKWTAYPSVFDAQVRNVQFLVDGKVVWQTTKAPYTYEGASRWKAMLPAGQHRFTVTVTDTMGRHATTTARASVTAL